MHFDHDHFNAFVPLFWGLFALVIIASRRWPRHRERMRAMEMAHSLAEKGLPVPPELAEAMKPDLRRPISPRGDIRSGVIALAIAAAIVVFALVVTMGQGHGLDSSRLTPLFGIAAFPGLFGLVLIGLGVPGPGRLGD